MESRRRNQTILDAPRRPDKQYFGAVPLLQFLRNSERRDNVSAGAAPRKNCPHDVNINRKLRRMAATG